MSSTDFPCAGFSELRLTECGRERCSPQKDVVFRSKSWHVLHYILYGKGTFSLGNREYKLSRGQVFYIPPGTSPHYYPDKNMPWTYVWMGLDGTLAGRYLTEIGLNEQNPIWRDDADLSLCREFSELADRFSYGGGKLNLDCFSVALKIIWEMTQRHTDGRTLSVKECHINEAKEYIANNYQFALTVKQIADSLGLAPNYLANIFDQVLGISPKQYLISYRIDKACELLLMTDLPVAEIAARVGYTDPFYFATAFRKERKQSPREYRKSNKL